MDRRMRAADHASAAALYLIRKPDLGQAGAPNRYNVAA